MSHINWQPINKFNPTTDKYEYLICVHDQWEKTKTNPGGEITRYYVSYLVDFTANSYGFTDGIRNYVAPDFKVYGVDWVRQVTYFAAIEKPKGNS